MNADNGLVLDNNVTVESLRKAGFKLRVKHIRKLVSRGHAPMYSIRDLGMQEDIVNNGGVTEVMLTTPDAKITVTGVAECGKKDQYNKKIGVQYAISRALKHLDNMGYRVYYNVPANVANAK